MTEGWGKSSFGNAVMSKVAQSRKVGVLYFASTHASGGARLRNELNVPAWDHQEIKWPAADGTGRANRAEKRDIISRSCSMRSTLLCGVGGEDHRFAAETRG